MKKSITTLLAIIFFISVSAQKKVNIEFGVSAVCSMCEDRIEAAYDVKGIVMADYDLNKKKLHIVYKTNVFTDILDVHRIAANAGHDTDKIKATNEAYSSLHHCCKYREATNAIECSGDNDTFQD